VAGVGLASQLAEIRVILLMFGGGLHFSIGDLIAVRKIVLPGAVGQTAIATAIGAGISVSWGWSLGAGLVLGLALSVASTVLLLRALAERNAVIQTALREWSYAASYPSSLARQAALPSWLHATTGIGPT
jgi:monovalent cation:H+ antiporter-2, CPA2 family